MNSLYVLVESYTNGYKIEALDLFSLISILSGILVITSKNPIVSVLFLISLFIGISSYLMVLGLSFIGLSYLLVYVGAISILFLFILMLINVRISELLSNASNSIPLAILIIIAFSVTVYQILPYGIAGSNSSASLDNYTEYFFKLTGVNQENNGAIFFVTSKLWDGNLSETSHITSIGNIMYTNYSIWLILTSIILLLAMVGAIVITIKQKK